MRITSIVAVLILLISPVLVSAQTVEELQAQANALLLKVQQLQQQVGAGGSTGAGCPLIGRILSVGSTGEDVTRLQQFLARDRNIYPEGMVTGYYGALTEAAVKRWQAAYNIVTSGTPSTTGFGQVGPRTAAAMSLQCSTGSGGSTGPAVGGFIRVTPIGGNAPLLVTVDATVNTIGSCSGAVYMVDYGDGTSPTQIVVPAGNCQQILQSLKHTYQNPGTYQVTLSSGAHRTSAIVTVSGSTQPNPQVSDSISANPTSGAAPLSVAFTGVMNDSKSCSGGVYTLQFGDNQSTQLTFPSGSCQAFSYSVTHQYTSAGTFNARLFKGTQTSSAAATTNITVTGGASPSPAYLIESLTPAVGGDPFAVSVQIEFPACAAYQLDWDDGSLPITVGAQTGCSGVTSNATHNHTYNAGGDYTITLKDGSGVDKSNVGVVISN